MGGFNIFGGQATLAKHPSGYVVENEDLVGEDMETPIVLYKQSTVIASSCRHSQGSVICSVHRYTECLVVLVTPDTIDNTVKNPPQFWPLFSLEPCGLSVYWNGAGDSAECILSIL